MTERKSSTNLTPALSKREGEGSGAIPKKNVIAKAQGFCAVAGPAAIFLIYKD